MTWEEKTMTMMCDTIRVYWHEWIALVEILKINAKQNFPFTSLSNELQFEFPKEGL